MFSASHQQVHHRSHSEYPVAVSDSSDEPARQAWQAQLRAIWDEHNADSSSESAPLHAPASRLSAGAFSSLLARALTVRCCPLAAVFAPPLVQTLASRLGVQLKSREALDAAMAQLGADGHGNITFSSLEAWARDRAPDLFRAQMALYRLRANVRHDVKVLLGDHSREYDAETGALPAPSPPGWRTVSSVALSNCSALECQASRTSTTRSMWSGKPARCVVRIASADLTPAAVAILCSKAVSHRRTG